jgi:hypothetical protein
VAFRAPVGNSEASEVLPSGDAALHAAAKLLGLEAKDLAVPRSCHTQKPYE